MTGSATSAEHAIITRLRTAAAPAGKFVMDGSSTPVSVGTDSSDVAHGPRSTDDDGGNISAAVASTRSTDDRLAVMADACTTILKCIGEDPTREGLLKTPMRMAKALIAMTEGYCQSASSVVGDALFDSDSDEMVVVRDVELFSMCEHHMLPFFGRAHVAYVPRGRVVGLSKLARIVDVFARRLQIQERLTTQIAQALRDTVGAESVAVMVDCKHMCMSMRGVEKQCASTITTCYLGDFKTDRALRSEFLTQLRMGGGGGGGALC